MSLKAYISYKKDTRLLNNYRQKNFRNLERAIKAHNLIVESPQAIQLSVMNKSLQRVSEQIVFYNGEIEDIKGKVAQYEETNLNKYGKATVNNLNAIIGEIEDILVVLNDVYADIEKEIEKKEEAIKATSKYTVTLKQKIFKIVFDILACVVYNSKCKRDNNLILGDDVNEDY